MHANVITWRLAPGEDLPQFVHDLTAQVGAWPSAGMVDGYIVELAADLAITVGVYETQAQADAVAGQLGEVVGALGHRAALVERRAGPAHEIWGSKANW